MLFCNLTLLPFRDSVFADLRELFEGLLLAVEVVNLQRDEGLLLLVGSQLHVLLEGGHGFAADPLLFVIPRDRLKTLLLLRELGPVLEAEEAFLDQLRFVVPLRSVSLRQVQLVREGHGLPVHHDFSQHPTRRLLPHVRNSLRVLPNLLQASDPPVQVLPGHLEVGQILRLDLAVFVAEVVQEVRVNTSQSLNLQRPHVTLLGDLVVYPLAFLGH